MTTGVTLGPKFQIGPRKAGAILGQTMQQYRCANAGPVVTAGNLIGTTPAWVTGDAALKAQRPIFYDKPAYAGVDPAIVAAGDYLVGPIVFGGATETLFVASADVPGPIVVFACNAVLSFSRPAPMPPGADFHAGARDGYDTPLLAGWPAMLVQGTKGEKGEITLPGDVRQPWVAIYLPPSVPVQLLTGDYATSAETTARSFTVSSVELTRRGYRLTASLETT